MRAEQFVTTLDGETGRTRSISLSPRRDDDTQELYILNIYPSVRYQEVNYFGGAITDSVCATLEKLPPDRQDEVINAYFGQDGIGYGAIRTHIDSCDFSTAQYCAADDMDSEFSLEHDIGRNIRWIKRACSVAHENLPVIMAPWSPPAYMKTNGSRTGGGRLRPEYYDAWAKYLCRYIKGYMAEGINVTEISVQNEPNAIQTWDSCLYTADEERTFISKYLYPAMCAEGLQNVKINIWDHNKERMFDRAIAVITDDTADMIGGVALHWYSGDHFDAVRLVRERFPDKLITFTEGCIEYSRFDQNQLANAQMYAHDMIGNFSAGMNNFIDWNICLDETGGPNYADNFCEAPVICDTRTGNITFKMSFKYIEHFSRYVKPGAKRVATTVYTDEIEQVAFINKDGSIVSVLLNRGSKLLPVFIRTEGNIVPLSLSPASISTVIIN